MAEIITLTDDTLNSTLEGSQPVLLLFTTGDGLRGDFFTAFRKAAQENEQMIFARIDPRHNPQAAQQFNIGSKALMIAWHCGETLDRRNRPWGSDVPATVDMLKASAQARPAAPSSPQTQPKDTHSVDNTQAFDAPVNVTEDTFEAEVINSDLPVLVDFWAEWCGPCRAVAPILDKLATEFAGQVKIAKVDVDANQGLAQSFQVMSIPNMMAIKNQTIVFNQPGALPEEALRNLIQQLIDLDVPDPETSQTPDAE